MKQKQSNIKGFVIIIAGIIAGIALDQYTKWLAVKHLKDQDAYTIIEGVFSLQYLENKGAAFGLMQNQKILFVIGSIIIVLLVAFCFWKMPRIKRFIPLYMTGTCILIGAFGNFIDRLRLGYVIDFFYFELINFPIFNVADIFITVSFVVLALLILFYYKEEELSWLSLHQKTSDKIEE